MLTFATVTKATLDVQIGDKTYTLSPLTLADWGDIEHEAQFMLIGMGRRACQDASTVEDKQAIMLAANKAAAVVSLANPDGAEGLLSSNVISRDMVWHSLRKNHHAITRAQVTALIDNLEDVGGFMEIVGRIARGATVGQDAAGTEATTTANP